MENINLKKTVQSSFIGILKEELITSKGPDRYLIIALIANIPTPIIFIPYVTEVITMILMGIYLFHYPKIEVKNDATKSIMDQTFLGIPTVLFVLAIFTIFIQLFWIPFMTQIISIASIILVYVFSTKFRNMSDVSTNTSDIGHMKNGLLSDKNDQIKL